MREIESRLFREHSMAARKCRLCFLLILFWELAVSVHNAFASVEKDAEMAAARKESTTSKIDTSFLLLAMALLILTVLTIWLFKVYRFRFLHETGVCMIYGMVVGLIIKYSGGVSQRGYNTSCVINTTKAKQVIWVSSNEKWYSYSLSGVVRPSKSAVGNDFEQKAVFDPEIFFYVLLPPIIFYAGYDMKKRFFFRNIGAILTYAFAGTTISCIVFGSIMYGYKQFGSITPDFDFLECLLFGALISATDPVTVLAIFHDMHVDVDLFALVFGESVMNDAVAIVLFRSVESYLLDSATSSGFQVDRFFAAVGTFIGVFSGSFALGFAMGLLTALITKLTKISDYPLLETALFFLLSWSTFLMAEAAGLTGIVAVLFCGISQAHYTYNNLSDESKHNTKQTFALLNFLAENFIFSYMGLAVFTFENHQWNPGFIAFSFLGIALGRFMNIYPLSFLLNIGRRRKIPFKFQNMMMFSGLRGAVAFALAMRNTESESRQLMLTCTLMIVLVTVVCCGGTTMSALTFLKIKVGVNPEEEERQSQNEYHSVCTDPSGFRSATAHYDRHWIFKMWYNFDIRFMKPLFTNKGPPLTETLPACCLPLARCLTKEERKEPQRVDSDVDMLEITQGAELQFTRPTSDSTINTNLDMNQGDLGLGTLDHRAVET